MHNTPTARLLARGAALGVAIVLLAGPLHAQHADQMPGELEGVGITERPGAQVPLDATFLDEQGREVRLASYLDGDKPVLLMLVYFRCPMLCGLVLNATVSGLKDLKWTPGEEFEIVTISIDPLETPTLARLKKQSMLRELERPEAASGWHFLTGRKDQIDAVAQAVGFGYRYNDERKEYAHAAAIFALTPDGTVSRTLYGIDFPSRTLRLALTEAADGEVGTPIDQFILTCFHYDPDAGSYVLAARRVMTMGGVATVVVLGVWLGAWWRREARRRTDEKE